MTTKRKYPKSFYDEGLGDILEWIDDEVLVHSEGKLGGEAKSSKRSTDKEAKIVRKKQKLYGENKIKTEDQKGPRQVRFDLKEEEDAPLDKKLEDRARGLINRLAAQTMPFVTSEFEKLYSCNSRQSVNSSIFLNIDSSIICSHAITKRKLVAELMLLVSYLSSKVSQDIGASLVHRLIHRFESLYTTCKEDEDKRMDNIVCCLLNLYIIGLISAHVIFEVAKRMCSSDFRSKSIELLLLVVKSVGFQLRKDNPLAMRELISIAQQKAANLKSSSDVGSRINFMTEALGAIKNNNMSKVVNYGCDIDKDTIESTLKLLISRTRLPESLSDATYDEIVNSSNWYLLETRLDDEENKTSKKTPQMSGTSSKVDRKICKALGLSKPAEKTMFSALLKVTDYVEASNLIIGFGMNYCSDAMVVCLQIAIHEKRYNPFHYNLINSLCKFNRKYKMAAKFAIQDKIRVLSRLDEARVDNFKILCLELIKSDAIPVSILKAVEWADLSDSTRAYLCYLLTNISELPDESRRKIMIKIDKRSSFAGAMRTFINCFLKGCKLFD